MSICVMALGTACGRQRWGRALLILVGASAVPGRLAAQVDNGSPLVSNISMDVCKLITPADLNAIAPHEKMAFLPSSQLTGVSFDGAIDGLEGAKQASCRYDSGQTTLIVEIGDLPGDKTTKGTELSKKGYKQVVQHWSPDPRSGVVESITPLPGIGEEGVLSKYRSGRVYIARQGSVVILAKLEGATASTAQFAPMPPLVKRLLARSAAIAATDTVETAVAEGGEGPDGPAPTGSATGSLTTIGAINTTWNYRRGGEINCGPGVEVPLESSTHDAGGYLGVMFNGAVTLSTGATGTNYTGKGGHLGDENRADTLHPKQHVSVDGVLADEKGKQIKVKAAFDLICK